MIPTSMKCLAIKTVPVETRHENDYLIRIIPTLNLRSCLRQKPTKYLNRD